MGWSTYHRPAGQTDREHFTAELETSRHEILDCATVKNVFYAAVRTKETGQVWAWVCLIHRAPRDYYNFGYKSMDETVGPNAADCPARILDLLTPTDSKYAVEWREACRKNLARKAEAKKSTAKVTDGTVIKLATPLNFQGGLTAQEFRLRVNGRTRRWLANPDTDQAFLCRLPQDWATRYTWEKISA